MTCKKLRLTWECHLKLLLASLKNTSDYGFTNDFFATEEEGLNHLSQLYKERDQAQMQLEELSNQPAWKKVNNTAIDEAKKKLRRI